MEDGKCTPEITKLSYNSIDMDFDFFDGETDSEQEQAQMIFTLGKDNKKNLEPALFKGGKQFFSKNDAKHSTCQVESEGEGWFIKSEKEARGQYAGVMIPEIETFYAVDVKNIKHNTLNQIKLQYTENGKVWKKIADFDLMFMVEGAVETIYFPPVYAVGMRIVCTQGAPNIKFEFYFNANRIT